MGDRGPPRTPLRILTARGSRKGRARAKNAPEPNPVQAPPSPPKWLDAHGRRAWRRLARVLVDMQLMESADRAAMEAFCQTWSEWRTALDEMRVRDVTLEDGRVVQVGGRYETVIDKQGNAVERERPQAKTAREARRDIHKMWGQFGLTPAARASLKVEKPRQPSESGGYGFAGTA